MPDAATGYRPLLRIPGATAFFLAAAVGRVGIAMTGLGLVWLLHARTGSYGTAGLAAAGFSLAEALVGPHLARLIDRFGQSRVLPFCLLAHGAAIAGVLASTTPAASIAAATCAGAVVPQLGALSAARWAHLLRGERAGELPAAFSLESLANATAFLLGPVLVVSLGAAGDAVLASALAAVLILGGGGALAAQGRTAPPPAREHAERARTGRTLVQPAFLLLALLNVLTEKAVHPAVLTQAFTWNNSASAAGLALAASLAGRAADAWGASAALALAPAAGLVLLVLSLVLSLAARRPGGPAGA